MDINRDRRQWAVEKLREHLGNLHGVRVGLLGLAFKPNTDDIREAASVDLIRLLQVEGASVAGYDPVAAENVLAVTTDFEVCPDPYEAARNADAVILVTDWSEFTNLDLARLRQLMRRPILIDGRNMYEPEQVRALGFDYVPVARGAMPSMTIAAEQRVTLRD